MRWSTTRPRSYSTLLYSVRLPYHVAYSATNLARANQSAWVSQLWPASGVPYDLRGAHVVSPSVQDGEFEEGPYPDWHAEG